MYSNYFNNHVKAQAHNQVVITIMKNNLLVSSLLATPELIDGYVRSFTNLGYEVVSSTPEEVRLNLNEQH